MPCLALSVRVHLVLMACRLSGYSKATTSSKSIFFRDSWKTAVLIVLKKKNKSDFTIRRTLPSSLRSYASLINSSHLFSSPHNSKHRQLRISSIQQNQSHCFPRSLLYVEPRIARVDRKPHNTLFLSYCSLRFYSRNVQTFVRTLPTPKWPQSPKEPSCKNSEIHITPVPMFSDIETGEHFISSCPLHDKARSPFKACALSLYIPCPPLFSS